jgi:hypothetical protein
LLYFQGHTFAFLLTLTDDLPFRFWQRRAPSEVAGTS